MESKKKKTNDTMTNSQTNYDWITMETYDRVNKEINDDWPEWKKEVYNEMFAVSAHAGKLCISK
ncbi:MAG: hypothetical protein ACI4E2_05520 [Acetatifactor sp.]